ncbi:MAG TPA: tetratricopeptide repeat protein [Vicinamibacteria bacterium]|nr:tetratricopeptide repeat protein [Vicinamibacteria bacterium]
MANQFSTPFDQGLFLVHLNRGREHFDSRNFADAAEELEEARRLRPQDDSVLNLLGLAYFKQEKYKDAESVYRKLIDLNPNSPTLYFNLGLICFKLGDLDRAEATFLKTLELKSDSQKTHFYLGNVYEKKKQYYNAIFQYRKAGANIMVKRVQEKIDHERPPTEDQNDFIMAAPPYNGDDTKPSLVEDHRVRTAPDLDSVTVDHIDKRRFLSALREGFAPPAGSTDMQQSSASARDSVTTKPDAGQVAHLWTVSDDQEVIVDPGAEPRAENASRPPPSTEGTRLRLSEPILQDESLAEMARNKAPTSASDVLFSGRTGPRFPAKELAQNYRSSGERFRDEDDSELSWQTLGPAEPHVYARGRRKDDLFRYLEYNLMEVNFSGKVFIKLGTIYSYSGNLTFWVKPQREERVAPLVIVSGTGKLLLTDRRREISVFQIENEQIFVEPSHLLACQETLTPRYAVVEKDSGGKPGFHVLMIEGTGMVALSVATSPLVLTVQREYPVNVASSSLISWSGDLTPTIVEDEALAEIMLPDPSSGINLRLEGEGQVMVEKITRPSFD